MITNELYLNSLQWSRLGTTLEFGYSVRDDDDEHVLGHFTVTVDNDEIEPHVLGIMEQFKYRISSKLHEETDR